MPNPTDILAQLIDQARNRPDLGTTQPTALYQGRMVTPQDTDPHEVLKRMPMGDSEGNTNQKLLSLLGAGGIPAAQLGTKTLVASLLPKLFGGAGVSQAIVPLGYAYEKGSGWRSWSPEAKASYTQVANEYPDVVKQLMESPTVLRDYKVGGLPQNTHGQIQPFKEPVLSGPQRQRHVQMVVTPESAKTTHVPLHEITHVINNTKFGAMSPKDAATIGYLLSPEINGPKGSLNQRIAQDTLFNGAPTQLLDKLGSFENARKVFPTLSAEEKAVNTLPPESLKGLRDPMALGPYGRRRPTSEIIGSLIGDEGLAYLSSAFNKFRTDSVKMIPSPLEQQLARRLNVGVPPDPLSRVGGIDEFGRQSLAGAVKPPTQPPLQPPSRSPIENSEFVTELQRRIAELEARVKAMRGR